MVETSVEIRLSPTAGTSLAVETNVAGEAEQQAELVCFAFFAVRIILLLEPSLRTPLVQSLTLLEEASAEHLESLASGNQPEVDDFRARRLALASSDSTASAESQFRATVRLNAARPGSTSR